MHLLGQPHVRQHLSMGFNAVVGSQVLLRKVRVMLQRWYGGTTV